MEKLPSPKEKIRSVYANTKRKEQGIDKRMKKKHRTFTNYHFVTERIHIHIYPSIHVC
jgi:hypothetical protein